MNMSAKANINSSGTRPLQSLAILSRPVDWAPLRARSFSPPTANRASCESDSFPHRTRIEGSFDGRDARPDTYASTLENAVEAELRHAIGIQMSRKNRKEGDHFKWGPAPNPPGFTAFIPIPRPLNLALNETERRKRRPASVLDSGSALGLLPSIALSSAQTGDIVVQNCGRKTDR